MLLSIRIMLPWDRALPVALLLSWYLWLATLLLWRLWLYRVRRSSTTWAWVIPISDQEKAGTRTRWYVWAIFWYDGLNFLEMLHDSFSLIESSWKQCFLHLTLTKQVRCLSPYKLSRSIFSRKLLELELPIQRRVDSLNFESHILYGKYLIYHFINWLLRDM